MKTENILLLGGAALLGLFLYGEFANKNTASTTSTNPFYNSVVAPIVQGSQSVESAVLQGAAQISTPFLGGAALVGASSTIVPSLTDISILGGGAAVGGVLGAGFLGGSLIGAGLDRLGLALPQKTTFFSIPIPFTNNTFNVGLPF